VAGAEEFVDLDLAPDGSLWAVGVSNSIGRNGLYHWENGRWEAHRAGYEYFGNYPTSVLADSHDNVWFGTWGRGLGHFDPVENEWQSFKHDTPGGQHMVGYSNDQVGESTTFSLVSDVEEDPAGNIWVVNHQALDDSCLVVIPASWHQNSDQIFARMYFEQDGVRFPYTIMPDTPGSIWTSIGGKDTRDNEKRVLHLLSYGHPPSELSEWQLNESLLASPTFNFGEDEPGLVSDMAADASGSIWVATDNGIYYGGMYGSQEQFSRIQFIAGLLSEVVSTVTVDDRGRIWMASSEGLNLFMPEELRFQTPPVVAEFNAMVSRLAGLQIHRICVNGGTGEIWLATNQGLFRSPTGGENYGTQPSNSLTVYPNPLRPERGERARVLREGLSNDATFAIYSADGRLLRRMKLAEMEVGWDGRDDTGDLVPAGVYVVLAVHDGESESTLLAVIR
jgi:streptogramin lyase